MACGWIRFTSLCAAGFRGNLRALPVPLRVQREAPFPPNPPNHPQGAPTVWAAAITPCNARGEERLVQDSKARQEINAPVPKAITAAMARRGTRANQATAAP